MTKYKAYSNYRDSKIPWLGEIPEHWEANKGKWIWKKEKRPIRKEDEIITAFRDGQVTLRKNRREDGFTIAAFEHGYQGIRKGDLVIHGMDAFAGAIGVSDSNGKSSPVYSACTPQKDANPYYFAYLLKEMSRTSWIEALARGIRERSTEFKYPQFANLILPLPPLSEQTAIANFLDRKISDISRFIALKEKTISLLKERKIAIINQAVTKGLDPDVPMRDSGIDWLGEIPAHWEVKKLKYILKESNKRTSTGKEELLSLSKYNGVIPKNQLEERAGQAENLIGYKFVLPNNIVVNKMQAVNGIIGVSKIYGITSPDYSIYELIHKNYCSDYFGLVLKHPVIINHYKKVVKGVMEGYIRLYTNDLYSIKTIVPPENEQFEIINHIQAETTRIDRAITSAEKKITLMKEYQQNLISEAVTGKIDVRDLEEEQISSFDLSAELKVECDLEEA